MVERKWRADERFSAFMRRRRAPARRQRWFAAAVAAAAFVMGTGSVVGAVPRIGSVQPNARFEDVDGHALELRAFWTRPTLIVYEDKGAAAQNAALKRDLSALAATGSYRNAIALVAIADVSDYDFWPARGFVRRALRAESEKVGTPIYCDWTGAFRRALGLVDGASNIVVLDRAARVTFAHAGALTESERIQVIEALRSAAAP